MVRKYYKKILIIESILICLFLVIGISVFGQANSQKNKDCKDLKLDTLEKDFIIEVNCDNLYYSTETVIFQSNLIFINPKCISNSNGKLLYETDSVFIYNWNSGIDFYKYKPCIDFNSLAVFHDKTENPLNKKIYRHFFKKSVIKNKDGIIYLRFHAKMIVSNLGDLEWNIPGIYCKDNNNVNKTIYCKHAFKNSLLLLEVLDFKYYSEYKEMQK